MPVEDYGLLFGKYRYPVAQVVFYIGSGKMTLPSRLRHPSLSLEYAQAILAKHGL